MMSCVCVSDAKSADNRYICQIVNDKKKFHFCLVQKLKKK